MRVKVRKETTEEQVIAKVKKKDLYLDKCDGRERLFLLSIFNSWVRI